MNINFSRIVLFVLLVNCAKLAHSIDALTPHHGVTISDGTYDIYLKPLIVTQEFGGQRVTSPEDVIVVFPYRVGMTGSATAASRIQISASFFDRDGNDLRLPTQSYADQQVGRYFMTFGPRALFNSGISVVPRKVGGAKFPAAKISLKASSSAKIHRKQADSVKEVQSLLNQAGYDAGEEDGILGSKTRAAIRQFQKDNGLTESGNVSAELTTRLKEFTEGTVKLSDSEPQ